MYYEVPATRAHSDRTVGIDVCRWRVGGGSQLVANIYDAAGQHVYRATHGLFMSPGALFLHVVRADQPEEAAVAGLLEWASAVQQEAPGAVMGIVWTHADVFGDGVCDGARWENTFLSVRSGRRGDGESVCAGHGAAEQGDCESAEAEERSQTGETWVAAHFLQHSGPLCKLEHARLVLLEWGQVEGQGGDGGGGNERINDEDVRGRVVVLDSSTDYGFWRSGGGVKLARALPVLERHGVVGMIVIGVDCFKNSKFDPCPFTISEPSIPIMLVPKAAAGALKAPNATMTAFPGV